jgi:N-methylhydantoinase B
MERLSEYLELVEEGGRKVIRCRCGYTIGPATDNYKKHALKNESPLKAAGPHANPHNIGGGKFVFRRFCCPGCLVLLGTEIALKGAPFLWDIQPKL